MIIEDAINEHFKKEQENFFRPNKAPRIKTLSLFFIDSVRSYRDNDGWLLQTFERLLKKKLKELIEEYKLKETNEEEEYLEFLIESNRSLCSN